MYFLEFGILDFGLVAYFMCGITGILAFSEEGKKIISFTQSAVSALAQRGPDDEGLFMHHAVALGHKRLAVIDTSTHASQPMSDASGRYTIVFNGEIFNFHQLKKELLAKGIKFGTQSDTEVLLYLFIAEKEKCLEKLDGEFVFAVYDKEAENLFLARDRFGIKPLYYFLDEDKFIFASEIKALLKYPVPKKLDETSLQIYLHLNYIPSPDTIFKHIRKFPSSCFAFVNHMKSSDTLGVQKYYHINSFSANLNSDYEEKQKKIYQLLDHSVRERMIADVPLGTFLSGGVDSSIISALAAKHTRHLQTFSIGYKDEKYFDETQYARIVAKKIKSEHTVFSLTNNDLFANLHAVLDYLDEPFADSSALAVHILSMHTRRFVKVALSGDGADELFGGYNKYRAERQARKKGVFNALLKSSKPILKALPKSRNKGIENKIRQLQKFTEGIKLSDKERYWRWAGFCSDNEIEKLFPSDYLKYKERKNEILSSLNSDFNSVLLTDVQLVLENDMLVKTDRMSMANSLEVRVPFLCHKIVDFVFSLPAEHKLDGRRRKKILMDTFRRELPAEIFSRKKKGFEVPLLKWFRTELSSMIKDDLLHKEFVKEQGLFNYEEINKLLRQLFSNNPDDSVARVWALIVFQYWWKKYFSNF